MGEPKEVWAERIKALAPYAVTMDVLRATGNPDVKFLHCLPAFHDLGTKVGPGDLRGPRARLPGGHGRGLRVGALGRLRRGGEPAAHHQGRPRRHPRLTPPRRLPHQAPCWPAAPEPPLPAPPARPPSAPHHPEPSTTRNARFSRVKSPHLLVAESGADREGHGLKRTMGLFQLVCFGVGAIVGTGIFVGLSRTP
ncbi:Ornithine carbamoyltransferase, catabolic [Streptomyces violaceorubidus]